MARHFLAVLLLASLHASSPEVRVDFRGKQRSDPQFRNTRPDHTKFMAWELNGLHIQVPAGTTAQAVGMIFNKQLGGDFDVTVTYELLSCANDEINAGSGVQLYLVLDRASNDALTLTHRCGPLGPICVFAQMITGESGNRVIKQARTANLRADDRAGRLRLRREGTLITAFYGTGADPASLKELGAFVLGNEPVKMFRISANPEGGMSEVNARFFDVAIRADDLGTTQTTTILPWDTDYATGHGLALGGLFLALLILLGVSALWGWQKKRRAPQNKPDQPSGPNVVPG
jgi:Protein of unknown function (DUF1583)